MKKNTTDIYEIISSKIETLLNQNLKYQKKWTNTQNGIAINAKTKHIYEGINQLLLSFYLELGEYKINKWLTFIQATELGGKVVKGEKAHHVVKFSNYYILKNNVTGKTITEDVYFALSDSEKEKYSRASFLKYFFVFNVSQIEGLPEEYYNIDDLQLNSFIPVTECENLASNYVLNSGLTLVHAAQSRAFYRPMTDTVVMPLPEQFENSNAYYKTLFHEFTHSTGHSSRLNRKSMEEFKELEEQQEIYALEELVAELGTAFINSKFGIETEITNNAAYIQSWLKALRSDKKFFVLACGMAQKATNYLFQISEPKSQAA